MAKLRHIAITVPDPEKAAQFYEKAFGLKRVGRTDWDGAHGIYLSDGVMNLALLHYQKEEYAGEKGRAFIIRRDGSREQLRSKGSWDMERGDRVRIETPSGGGWGKS